MRRYKVGPEGDAISSAERLIEAELLDDALSAVGSKFSVGYRQRLSALDLAVCGFVDGLRKQGIGPAEVLVRLKERLAARRIRTGDVDAFAVRRCIARYFEN